MSNKIFSSRLQFKPALIHGFIIIALGIPFAIIGELGWFIALILWACGAGAIAAAYTIV